MAFADRVWTVQRFASAPDSQRFTGRIGEDGHTIAGSWEISKNGSSGEHDFDLTYTGVE